MTVPPSPLLTVMPQLIADPGLEPSAALANQMLDGRLEELVVKDRRSPYRDASRAGWYEREARPFQR